MCELLGTKTKTGKSKQLHLEDIEREFELSKTPKGIIVVRELDEIEKKVKKAKGKFVGNIEILLLTVLAKTDDRVFTYNELYRELGMVNEDYVKGLYNKKVVYNKISLTKDNTILEDEIGLVSHSLNVFYTISKRQLKEVLKSSLNSMKNRGLLIYQETFKLGKTVYTQNGRFTNSRECNDNECKKILELRKEAMLTNNIQELSNLYFMSKEDKNKFYNDFSILVSKEFEGWEFAFEAIKILDARKFIVNELKEVTNKKELNMKIVTKLTETNQLDMLQKTLRELFIIELVAI